jgi:hypothetical protein
MKPKLIRNVSALQGEVQFNAQASRIAALLIVAEGTNNTGETGDATDVGRFLINRFDNQTHNRKFETFQKINDIRGGTSLTESTKAGDFKHSCIIPFFEKGFFQALNITDENELNIRIQPSNSVPTVFESLNIKVYALNANVGERYDYYMVGNDQSYASSVSAVPESFARENITNIFIENPDSIIEYLQLEQNGETLISNIDYDALKAITAYQNLLEDGTNINVVELKTFTEGVRSTVYNTGTVLTVSTAGAGKLLSTVCAMQPHENF